MWEGFFKREQGGYINYLLFKNRKHPSELLLSKICQKSHRDFGFFYVTAYSHCFHSTDKVKNYLNLSIRGVLYISTSVWVLRTPNTGRNNNFQHFLCKKAKKARNLQQNFEKKPFFEFAPKHCLTSILVLNF